MDIIVNSENMNNLLNRKELVLFIKYKGSTPSKSEIRQKISALFNVNFDLVIIQKILSKFGKEEAECQAKIYFTKERLEEIEPKHILLKNKSVETTENEVKESE